MTKIRREKEMPEGAKYQVWQFGEASYFSDIEIANDAAIEFWCRDHSEIMEIVDNPEDADFIYAD